MPEELARGNAPDFRLSTADWTVEAWRQRDARVAIGNEALYMPPDAAGKFARAVLQAVEVAQGDGLGP